MMGLVFPSSSDWTVPCSHPVSSPDTPPAYSILRIEKTPPVGGATGFINIQTAYDKLSPALKEFAKTLKVLHSVEGFRASTNRKNLADYGIEVPKNAVSLSPNSPYKKFPLSVTLEGQEKDLPFPAEHPLVRTHPITGRSG